VWNAATGDRLATVTVPKDGDAGGVLSVAMSRDHLIAANSQRTYLWSASYQPRGSRPGRPATSASALSPAGDRLATVFPDGRISIHDLGSERSEVFEGHSGPVLAVAWSSDGRSILSGGRGGSVLWRDVVTGEVKRRLSRGAAISAIALTADDRWIVSAAGGVVRIEPTTVADARARACATLKDFGELCDFSTTP
jgi:WD40 repeat protein